MSVPIMGITESGRVVGVRLCEFPTGSAQLLQAHKDWITTYFVPKMRQNPNAWVDLIGDASMLGTPAQNHGLSNNRIAAVELFLKSQYPGIKVNRRIPHGSTEAADYHYKPTDNAGYWRAVRILWFGVPLVETPVNPPQTPSAPATPGPIDKFVALNGTPINPKHTGRMLDIWGEAETPPGFENYATNTEFAKNRPLTSDPSRPPGIGDKTVSDICIRDSPVSTTTLSEIRRIAQPGCRVTIALGWSGDPKKDDVPGGTTSQLKKARDFFPNRKDIAEGFSGKKDSEWQTALRKVIVFEIP